MLAAIRVTPRLACGLLRAGHNLTHLADHAEQRRLIHLFAPLLPQFRQRLPLFRRIVMDGLTDQRDHSPLDDLRRAYRARVGAADLTKSEAERFNEALENGLTGYTYLDDSPQA